MDYTYKLLGTGYLFLVWPVESVGNPKYKSSKSYEEIAYS